MLGLQLDIHNMAEARHALYKRSMHYESQGVPIGNDVAVVL